MLKPEIHFTRRLYATKSGSSARWKQRAQADPYARSKISRPENLDSAQSAYTSRAAFKLLQLDAKYRLLTPGSVYSVVDLGAAPGGWTQVAAQKLHATRGAQVVALDLLPLAVEVASLPNVTALQGDFLEEAMHEQLANVLGGRPVDLCLSDMVSLSTCVLNAPLISHLQLSNVTGNAIADAQASLFVAVFQVDLKPV